MCRDNGAAFRADLTKTDPICFRTVSRLAWAQAYADALGVANESPTRHMELGKLSSL
jgi:hypothetical protein